MKPLIQIKEGRTFLEDFAWEVAFVSMHGEPAFADLLLDQIENEIDRAYCQDVASGFWTSMSGYRVEEEGALEPDEALLLLH
jgi:hypothetical protein